MKAHQRLIREQKEQEEGLEKYALLDKSLDRATVFSVPLTIAKTIILEYEWLRSMGTANFAYGIFFDGVLGGVVCFGYSVAIGGYHNYVGRKYADKKTLITLCRGACTHWTPNGSASKLISTALKLVKALGYKVVIAYSDDMAGEIGTVYQATNWIYCGVQEAQPKHFDLYKDGKFLLNDRDYCKRYSLVNLDEVAKSLGAEIRRRKPKHRYFYLLGSHKENKEIMQNLKAYVKPYPKRIAGEVSRRETPDQQEGKVQSLDPAPISTEKPEWRCSKWGTHEHDWLDCPDCLKNYSTWLETYNV